MLPPFALDFFSISGRLHVRRKDARVFRFVVAVILALRDLGRGGLLSSSDPGSDVGRQSVPLGNGVTNEESNNR
jgi:hypothetical protein